ncbi:MAG TPA: MMPL family transporter, partial [Planctomycetota bacterium]|nr:MMPL family transporter [Planctomycetota bacterium]
MKFDYVAFCRRHYAVPLLIAVALATVGFFGAKRISLDPSTTSLLPEDTPTLAALEELERRVPGASRAYFLVQSSDPAFNVRATARIKEEVEKWEETRWALDRRDPQALLERRLQLLPLAELERLADDVETIVDWEECKRLPGCTNFEARPEIPKEEELDARFMAVPEVSSLVRYIGRTSIFDKKGETSRPAALPDGALCNADGTTCAVEVSLDGSASNLAFATKIFERGEALLASLEFEDAPADLQTAFTGNYRSAPMTKRIMERDLSVTSWISTIAVVLWLILQFRGFRPLILLVLPLGVSVLVTLGLVGALGMELNLVSAFTFAILIGVGVDFGVHLLMHYGDFRRRGVPVFEAIRSASRELRVSMITAASTTAFTFGMLAVADFRGLSQLGLIAAVGVFIAMLTYRALIPPLVVALDRIVPEKASLLRTLSWIKSDVLGPAGAKVLAISFVALALGFGLHAKDVEFEYDFQRLNPPETQHGMSQGETLHGASGVPIYVLAGDVTEATRVASTVERELVEMGFAPADRVLSLSLASFLPPDVDARVAEVRRMREALDRIWDRISEADRARFARLRDLLETEDPITLESLPPYVRDAFVERDGTAGAFAVVYVRVSGSDAILMEELSGIIQGFRERFPGVRFAAPKAVVGEIMPSLRADGPMVVGLTLLGLFFTTWAISRSLKRSFLVLVPVVLGSGIALGLLGIFDVRINFYNMLIIPVSYGLGIDGAIYVAWAMEGGGGEAERSAALATARRGVLASTL